MKKIFILVCGLFLALSNLHAEEIRFEQGTWAEALSKAKTTNKLVFLDAYTSWCGPCKWMAKNTFTNPEVAAYFNAHFVNVSMDMEKGEGPEIAKTYNVSAYPTLIFVDGEGSVVNLAIGALDGPSFLELGQKVVGGEVSPIMAMQKRWRQGDRDRAFLHDYILALADMNMEYMEPLAIYREGMNGAALLEPENWEIFVKVFRRTDTEWGKYFLSHMPDFEQRFGKEAVEAKALEMYNAGLWTACANDDKAALEAVKEEVRQSGLKGIEPMLLHADLQWAGNHSEWKEYASILNRLRGMKAVDTYILNSGAWMFYENVDDKKLLKTALVWANESVEEQKLYANMDTKAMVLMKLGRNDEAITVAKEAIEIAKASGEDYAETEAALNEMLGK